MSTDSTLYIKRSVSFKDIVAKARNCSNSQAKNLIKGEV